MFIIFLIFKSFYYLVFKILKIFSKIIIKHILIIFQTLRNDHNFFEKTTLINIFFSDFHLHIIKNKINFKYI